MKSHLYKFLKWWLISFLIIPFTTIESQAGPFVGGDLASVSLVVDYAFKAVDTSNTTSATELRSYSYGAAVLGALGGYRFDNARIYLSCIPAQNLRGNEPGLYDVKVSQTSLMGEYMFGNKDENAFYAGGGFAKLDAEIQTSNLKIADSILTVVDLGYSWNHNQFTFDINYTFSLNQAKSKHERNEGTVEITTESSSRLSAININWVYNF